MKTKAAVPHFMLSGLSRAIQSRREFLNMTQEQLSSRCGLHRTYISDIERGARNLSLKNLSRLATALELSPSTLIRLTEIATPPHANFESAEEELRDLWENAPVGYHSVDKNGTFVRMNNTELGWLGYTRDEVVGKLSITDVLTTESLRVFQDRFSELKDSGEVKNLEIEYCTKEGNRIPVVFSANTVSDPTGCFVMTRSVVIPRNN